MRQLDPLTGLIVVGDLSVNYNVVTMKQARIALLEAGMLDAVEAALASMPDGPDKRKAKIEWDFAGTVERDSALTRQMAQALELSESDLDDLFKAAAHVI